MMNTNQESIQQKMQKSNQEKCEIITRIITDRTHQPKYDIFAEISLGRELICSDRNISFGYGCKQKHAEEAVLEQLLKKCSFQNIENRLCFKVS